ncbi:MAG TPA: hypothetical protein VFV28_03550 [Limnobacter sp.]|nr:hypothetical protein [Limnobacter sp.]
MWNGLFFGLMSLFSPQASLPDLVTVESHIQQFAQLYRIDAGRIQLRKSVLNNPSPFLTHSGIKTCTVHINHHSDAKRVWSHFLNTGHDSAENALLAFTSAHELTHCLLSEPGRRPAARKALENHLGYSFRNNTHFEETLADLVGLAYVQKTLPADFGWVLDRLKTIRTDFSSRDPDHDSSSALQAQSLELVDRLFSLDHPLRLAETSTAEKFAGN